MRALPNTTMVDSTNAGLKNVQLTFQAVPGRIYHIQGRNELPNGTNAWATLATVTNDGDDVVAWTDIAPTNLIRTYRIKIPQFVP